MRSTIKIIAAILVVTNLVACGGGGGGTGNIGPMIIDGRVLTSTPVTGSINIKSTEQASTITTEFGSIVVGFIGSRQ